MDILEEIISLKKQAVNAQKRCDDIKSIMSQAADSAPCKGFRHALEMSRSGIIAEFKRHSPSKGAIFEDADPAEVVNAYAKAGAAACSVLTERAFFKAQADDFKVARRAAALPLLRKDFILDEYQVYETKAMGADAILLITAILRPSQIRDYAALAKELGLDTILEVHKKEELACVTDDIDIIGINNRNLGSFHTSVQNSFLLAGYARNTAKIFHKPPLLISESGIENLQTVKQLRKAGFKGFLIGERFMKSRQPGESLEAFLAEKDLQTE